MTCPNCGAPITGSKCEFCGSVIDNYKNNRKVMSITPNEYEALSDEEKMSDTIFMIREHVNIMGQIV